MRETITIKDSPDVDGAVIGEHIDLPCIVSGIEKREEYDDMPSMVGSKRKKGKAKTCLYYTLEYNRQEKKKKEIKEYKDGIEGAIKRAADNIE